MGLSRNKVAVSEGAAGSPPFYGDRAWRRESFMRRLKKRLTEIACRICVVQYSRTEVLEESVLQTQRVHPFPFRTRKLSSAVATILCGRLHGKIAQCRHGREDRDVFSSELQETVNGRPSMRRRRAPLPDSGEHEGRIPGV